MRNDARGGTYAIGELARLSGVSIRTLRHYDAIGLLKPASVGENGYRRYGREELLRLQQILVHREFAMSLADIAALLDARGFDRLAALQAQRGRLEGEARRLRRLLRTIDRTIADLEGARAMKDDRLYEGFSPEKQAEYEDWIVERYGAGVRERIEAGRDRLEAMTAEQKRAHLDEIAAVEADLGRAMGEGIGADDPRLDAILRRHHAWVGASWASPPVAEAYAGLGELYLSHPDFTARYEAVRPGFAAYLAAAMKAYAGRRL